MQTLKVKKVKILMIILILLIQAVAPLLTVIVENSFTLTTFAATTEWDISATENDNVKAVFDDETGTLTISGTGEMKGWEYKEDCPWYLIRKQIKTVIIENGVITIGKKAFYECNSLTKISIPEGVTSIGDHAFYFCSSLSKISIPEGVTSIENHAFFYCSSLTKISIPEGVTSIGEGIFSACSKLTEIIIPSTVTSIGNKAFSGCYSLAEITIPDNVTNIAINAFSNTVLIKTVQPIEGDTQEMALPGIIKRTMDKEDILYSETEFTLTNCKLNEDKTKLIIDTEILNKKTASLGVTDGALSGLTVKIVPSGTITYNITSATTNEVKATIYIAEGETIQNNEGNKTYTFTENGTFTFEYLTVNGENKTATAEVSNIFKIGTEWDVSKNGDGTAKAVFDDETDTLTISGTGEMRNWSNSSSLPWYPIKEQIKTVIIENGVTSIGESAFYNCSNLTEISIPEGVAIIGRYAFYSCSSLIEITISKGVTSIGEYAFYNCSSLTKILIPEGVININEGAFSGCSSLIEIEVNENNKKYTSEEGVLYNKEKTRIICYPAGKVETKFEILNTVTRIESFAFSGCSSLIEIIIPNEITKINTGAFISCSNLTKITIPSTVTSIENQVFRRCSSLTEITIPDGVSNIGWLAFGDCDALSKIIIPDSVSHIDDMAFAYNRTFTIYCRTDSTAHTYAIDNNIPVIVDDNAPVINSVTGNAKEWTKESVTLTVKATDEISGLAEKAYSFDGGETWQAENTKTYTENTNNIEIKVRDAVGNITTYETINITNIFEIEIAEYEEREESEIRYLTKINPETTITEMLENIKTNGEIKVYNGETELTDNAEKVSTGMTIKITLEELTEEYVTVVTGDVNGNGKADLNDILAINKHRLNKVALEGAYLLAGDVDENGKADLNDILKINRYRLGKIDSL